MTGSADGNGDTDTGTDGSEITISNPASDGNVNSDGTDVVDDRFGDVVGDRDRDRDRKPDRLAALIDRTRLEYETVGPGVRIHGGPFVLEFNDPVEPSAFVSLSGTDRV